MDELVLRFLGALTQEALAKTNKSYDWLTFHTSGLVQARQCFS